MRKFIASLIGIASILLIALMAIRYAPIPVGMATSYKGAFNVFPLDSIVADVLFIGPSTLAFGLHEETLIESGIDFFSFGLYAGTGPSYVINEAKQIGRKANYIIMSPGPPWLDQPREGDMVPELLSHSRLGSFEVLKNYGLRVFVLSKAWAFAHHFRPWLSYYGPSKVMEGFHWSSDIISKRGVILDQNKRRNDFAVSSADGRDFNGGRFVDFEKNYDLETGIDFSFWRQKKNEFTHLLPVPVRASRAAYQYVNAMNSLSLELSRPLLLTPESCVFPDTLFCDELHLNLKGSEIYSEMIARAINGLP